jgi:hypothetical protein
MRSPAGGKRTNGSFKILNQEQNIFIYFKPGKYESSDQRTTISQEKLIFVRNITEKLQSLQCLKVIPSAPR